MPGRYKCRGYGSNGVLSRKGRPPRVKMLQRAGETSQKISKVACVFLFVLRNTLSIYEGVKKYQSAIWEGCQGTQPSRASTSESPFIENFLHVRCKCDCVKLSANTIMKELW